MKLFLYCLCNDHKQNPTNALTKIYCTSQTDDCSIILPYLIACFQGVICFYRWGEYLEICSSPPWTVSSLQFKEVSSRDLGIYSSLVDVNPESHKSHRELLAAFSIHRPWVNSSWVACTSCIMDATCVYNITYIYMIIDVRIYDQWWITCIYIFYITYIWHITYIEIQYT